MVQAADAAAARIDRDLAGQPATEAGVRLALGDTYRGTGAYAKAEAQVRRALALLAATAGPESAETGQALNALGAILMERSKYRAADSVLARALSIHRRNRGPDGVAYATALVRLGQVAYETSDLERAEPQLRESVGILKRSPRSSALSCLLVEGRYTLGVTLYERSGAASGRTRPGTYSG